ncbi:MAG: TerC/Alx family metal homeostasis rane protein [Flavisolibacter sp.]|jgi:tellurite resistance protein TerC|nr:TerC/Alx family metal homeostasis rane protein [Flavisolibacter sp.]
MTDQQLTYLVFGIVLTISIIIDLGVFSKKSGDVSIKKALYQSLFWIGLGLSFFAFIWAVDGEKPALEYLSAYLMEKSLSIDNIFVFILIFSFYKVRHDHVARALMIGILLAIVFRVIFITVGVVLVSQFSWILYIFGAFLLYTGIKIFVAKHEENYDPSKSPVYKFIDRFFPIVHKDVSGKFSVKINGKRFYTNMFVVTILLGTTDIVFALDSIPAVFAISQDPMIIYTSNIFAVLGLRALFFLLKGAVAKFEYLQQGIAIVLIFIGAKMLAEHWLHQFLTQSQLVLISLLVIVICLAGSMLYSLQVTRRRKNENDLI